MRRSTETTAHDHTARIARAARVCAFVLPLILSLALLGVKSSQAAAPPPALNPFALEGLEEGGEELALEGAEEEEALEDEAEFAEAECEIAAEEAAEGEITQAEADALCREVEDFVAAARNPTAVPRCPIRSARAHASLRRHKLKLTIGYTTNAPVKVTIQIRGLGSFKRKLGRSGVLRFAKRVNRTLPRKQLRVRLRLPVGSAGCPSRRLVLFPR